MKKYLYILSSLTILAISTLTQNAIAANIEKGAQVFSANCSACHAGGKNVIMPSKSLSKEDLETYEMNSVEAITNQVNYGKNAMPAFGGRLEASDIEDVANYVLSQSELDWK